MTKSIRGRLQWWYGSILLAALTCFGGLVYLRADRDMHERALRQSLAALDDLAAGLRASRPRHPRDARPDFHSESPPENASGQPLPAELLFPLPPPPLPPPPPAPHRSDAEQAGSLHRGRPPRPGQPDTGRRQGPPPGGARPPLGRRGPPDRLEFIVWNADGSRIMQSRGPGAAVLASMARPEAFPEPRVRQTDNALQVFQLGPADTVLLVHRTLADDQAGLHLFGGMIAFAGGLTIATAVLGGRWIAGKMVQPINGIAETAATISVARLDRRIETSELEEELVPLANVLNQTFQRLQLSFEQLTQFTADASHELRTPLAVIQARTELALLQPRTPEQYQETLRTCLQSAERMRGLVEALLLLARGDARQLPCSTAAVDLRDIAGEACAQLQAKAETAGLNLELKNPDTAVTVAGNAGLLEQIADNLISNAIQHTPPGGTVKVVVDNTLAPTLQVIDSGCGIAPEHQTRIFDRFYRIDESRGRRNGGNGLGLAICQSLAELHGAAIQCHSEPGKGSQFTVNFPAPGSNATATQTDKQRNLN